MDTSLAKHVGDDHHDPDNMIREFFARRTVEAEREEGHRKKQDTRGLTPQWVSHPPPLMEGLLYESVEVPQETRETTKKAIKLPCGSIAWVDAEDYDRLSRYAWRKGPNGRKDRNLKYYVYRCEYVNGKRIKTYLHREILGLKPGDGKNADHIDGDPMNNVRSNLRVATPESNMQNRRKSTTIGGRPTSSPYKGVVKLKDRERWVARIWVKGEQVFLGHFDDEREAARCYDAAALEAYGEFAWLNSTAFPELRTQVEAA
jgi:hypothetical protein